MRTTCKTQAHTCQKEVTLYSIFWLISHLKCASIVHITCDICILAPICYLICVFIYCCSEHNNMIRVGCIVRYMYCWTLLCVCKHMRNILIKLCRQFMSLHAKIMVQCTHRHTHTVLQAGVCLPFRHLNKYNILQCDSEEAKLTTKYSLRSCVVDFQI